MVAFLDAAERMVDQKGAELSKRPRNDNSTTDTSWVVRRNQESSVGKVSERRHDDDDDDDKTQQMNGSV